MKFFSILLLALSFNAMAWEEQPFMDCVIEKGSMNAGQSFKLYAASEYERDMVFSAKLSVPYAKGTEFVSKGTSNITGTWSRNFRVEDQAGVYAAMQFKKAPGHMKNKFKATFIVAGLPNPFSSDDIIVAEAKCEKLLQSVQ